MHNAVARGTAIVNLRDRQLLFRGPDPLYDLAHLIGFPTPHQQ